jgi:poly(3-hydroxybutyrate) depolymerase
MLYHVYEMNHAAMMPLRIMADAGLAFWNNNSNPLSRSYMGRAASASLEMFERMTRRYGKPDFAIESTIINGAEVPVLQKPVLSRPFARLLHFAKYDFFEKQPKLLIVAPMSGHYATLLRATVEGLLPHFDVYITDWADARTVPLSDGVFDLDDYVDYVTKFLHQLGEPAHVMAVCQPSVPVMAAVTLMSQRQDPYWRPH